MVYPFLQAHPLERLHDPLPALPLGHRGVDERQLHVFVDVELCNEVVLLKDKAQHFAPDVGQLVVVKARDFLSVEEIFPQRGDVKRADDVHTGRLARARLPHNGHKFTLLNLKRDVVDRANLGIAHLVNF